MIDTWRESVVASTADLFSHGPPPLADTMSHRDDPGLLGPDSVSWEVIGDASAFVGGIRALLIQAAHPEVVAGVEDHSRYRADPLGRLSRTSYYVTSTTYGSMPEVDDAVRMVKRAHGPVRGESARGRSYRASDPQLGGWVHNALTDSFLNAFQTYGPRRLHPAEADRFVQEQALIGGLLGASPLPDTAATLRSWIADHPDLARAPAQHQTMRFLRRPPLPAAVQLGYQLLLGAAVATLPPPIAEILGAPKPAGLRMAGRVTVDALRWALGASPSWHLALLRVNAEIPADVFRQRLPEHINVANLEDAVHPRACL